MPDDPTANQPNPIAAPKPSFVVDSPPPSPMGEENNAPVSTENVETPPPPIVSQEESSQNEIGNNYGIPPVVTTPKPKSKSKKGMVAAILGILLLVGGIGAGVFLVQRQQLFKQKAAGNPPPQFINCEAGTQCHPDHEAQYCNDQGQMCTYKIGECGFGPIASCNYQASDHGVSICNANCPAGVNCNGRFYCIPDKWCIANPNCEYGDSYGCQDDSACQEVTPPTSTPTATPTPTPAPLACTASCDPANDKCQSPNKCLMILGGLGFACQNENCLGEEDCICPTATATASPTATATAAPVVGCNSTCSSDADCNPPGISVSNTTYTCYQPPYYCPPGENCIDVMPPKVCRNASCPESANCICSVGYFRCVDVKAYSYDPESDIWTRLYPADLAKLTTGDKVRFTVSGDTNYGNLAKAIFQINNVCTPEVFDKKAGPPSSGPVTCLGCSNEFYYEYTVPEGVTAFTVNAKLYVDGKGWMGGDFTCP